MRGPEGRPLLPPQPPLALPEPTLLALVMLLELPMVSMVQHQSPPLPQHRQQ